MNDKDAVDTLNDLIEVSKDGEFGFRSTAEHVRDPALRALLLQRATECRAAAAELQAQVVQHGGEAEDSGSSSGALHRGWVAVKGALTGYSEKQLLEECERGEDVALDAYRKALARDGLTTSARALIEHQYEGVKRNHAQIRQLRDQARAADS